MITVIAIIISILLPGLGHLLFGKVKKGLVIFFSFTIMILLLLWRINFFLELASLNGKGLSFLGRYGAALVRHPGFVVLITAGLFLVWLFSIIDLARLGRKKPGMITVFVVILLAFFVMGWQISELDIGKMFGNLSETTRKIGRIMWPWKAMTENVELKKEAVIDILVNDSADPPPLPPREEGKQYLSSDKTYGRLSEQSGDETKKGDILHLNGSGFDPDKYVEIYWKTNVGDPFRPRQDGQYTGVMTDADGNFSFDLVMPYRMIPASAAGRQIHQVIARQVYITGKTISQKFLTILEKIVETVFMGMIATFFGILFAIPVSFLAARNLMSGSRITLAIYYLVRTILNIIRSIEPLIWGLIAVTWVGLGPFAGVIALTLHSVAALGKLYSEAIENIEPGQIEAIQATGATKIQTIMYAVIPQMIPPFVSFTIYRWDINVRMSTIIGMVGGGGIGFILQQHIRLLDYEAAGLAMILIAIIVSILDYVSSKIRQKFI
ncbi:MAG: phosphonate ABC transporter, permease protein PhnE [Spirochaetales bacterium]|nr:phosphonate ABC transporter, permease protein PhnE [Spirochaetales bacterium]